ncbi:Uncharacterised protein [Legionella lansingensis]|uniref:Uncharacterized protein n=1 Tax=Legionella lansingensis TaxID=45067 RepID=A0A0W0VZF1_9GAMM|nr:hypothetical protein [Legionella lansingensis]KTD25393.1 hypothetical protein Llan_0139 [Legionella lansingensis]SNV51343.1 Uncharacterised protein [Legionella lansingensis]
MKQNLIIGFIAAAMSFANMSHADFIFHSSASNACEDVSGYWTGKGKASNWLIGDCVYHGSGTVSALDSTGHFTVEVTADKDSGSFVCPKHTTEQLTGVCVNGVATIMTQYGDLTGNFTKNTGDAKGTLSASPGVDVYVTIKFIRAG